MAQVPAVEQVLMSDHRPISTYKYLQVPLNIYKLSISTVL